MADPRSLIANPQAWPPSGRFCAILGQGSSKYSRSPRLWNAAFGALGLSVHYAALDVSEANLRSLLAALRDEDRFLGGNVTVPHKVAAAVCIGDLDPQARIIGAVNTISRFQRSLRGHNTDGDGAVAAVAQQLGCARLDGLAGRQVFVLGAGGSARAVTTAFAEAVGPAGAVHLYNRTELRGRTLAEKIQSVYGNTRFRGPSPLPPDLSECNILINCTPVGQAGTSLQGQSPIGAMTQECMEALSKDALVFDLIYNPANTPLLQAAAAAGLEVLNGETMLQEQAVHAFCRFVIGPTQMADVSPAELQRIVRDAMSLA